MDIIAYKDKVYKKLLQDRTRNRILEGKLQREEYDSIDVWEFLTLLRREIRSSSTTEYREIIAEECKTIVKRAKRMSTSSIFLNKII